MYRIKRLLYIHIILIYFTFIYSIGYSSHKLIYATTTATPSHNEDFIEASQTMSDEELRLAKERLLTEAREVVLGLKGQPSPASANRKAYIPRAILEEYIKMRDSVRETIPDDKDFFGKIDINDLDEPHENFWDAVYNKYNSFDISVDMGPPDEGLESRKFHYKGEASHIAHVAPEYDPEDVPPNIEPILPPHSRSMQTHKQFFSVHLRFNLSQEFYTRPTAADDLRGAELYLNRDRLNDCRYQDCDSKPMPFFTKPPATDHVERPSSKDRSHGSGDESDPNNIKKIPRVPRFQRVYILHIFHYDQFGEPVAKIHSSLRIDTSENTPLTFNIYPIVKSWLLKPSSNYGIIVRVTNEDKQYESLAEHHKSPRRLRPTRSSNSTTQAANASDSTILENPFDDVEVLPPDIAITEHVRLKREFRSTSESEETWIRKQPSILIFSKPSGTNNEKKHVKRHHEPEGHEQEDEMQSDEPSSRRDQSGITSTTSASASSTSGSDEMSTTMISENISKLPNYSSTEKSISAHPMTSTGLPIARREHSSSGNRRSNQRNTRPSNQSSGGSSQRSRGKGKQSARNAEKCSKRSMTINFDEVGWSSWIIAPQAYNANYCAGDCSWPLSDAQNATNHAIIQAIYHSVGRVVPRSCCAPVKLGKMAILYQLDGIVQMRSYDDMIVEACGCL